MGTSVIYIYFLTVFIFFGMIEIKYLSYLKKLCAQKERRCGNIIDEMRIRRTGKI